MKTSPILLALSLAVILAGCNRVPAKNSEPPPPEVIVAKPVVGRIADYEEFTGHTEAVKSIVVRAMVTGYLDKVFFKEGDDVAEDAPLFKIDPRIYQAQLDQAGANLVQARAHLHRLESDLRRATALLRTKAISQEDYDKEEGDRNEAAAGVQVAEAAEKLARQNVDYTTIKAPIRGRISRQMIDPGNMVKAVDTALTSVVALDPMYIYFDVDERTSPRVRALIDEAGNRAAEKGASQPADKGQVKIAFGLADEEGFPREAAINFVDNQIDSATGTLRLRAVIDNPQHLLPFTFLRVRVPTGKPHDALFVPERALGSDQGQKFLFLVDGERKAVQKQVTCGPLRDGMRAILGGLGANDRFVVSGLQRIRSGDVVDAKEEKPKEATVSRPTAALQAEPKATADAKRS